MIYIIIITDSKPVQQCREGYSKELSKNKPLWPYKRIKSNLGPRDWQLIALSTDTETSNWNGCKILLQYFKTLE